MSKELYISSSPHETKVAVLEDDLLVEVYHERDVDVGLVGGIYKGRVSRVLPGMQSAFVNIGLERDAFLYVSDFYEDEEEYDKVFTEAEARATRFVEGPKTSAPEPPPAMPAVEAAPLQVAAPTEAPAVAPPPAPIAAPVAPPTVTEPAAAAPPSPQPPKPRRDFEDSRQQDHRGRRRRRHGRGFGEQRRFGPKPELQERPPERPAVGAPQSFEILPGESLAKYRGAAPSAAPEETAVAETPDTGVPEAGLEPVAFGETEAPAELAPPSMEMSAQIPPPEASLPTEHVSISEDAPTDSASAEMVPAFEPRFIAAPAPVAAPPVVEPPVASVDAPATEVEATHVGVRLPVLSAIHEEVPPAGATQPSETTPPSDVLETSASAEQTDAPAVEDGAGPAPESPALSAETAEAEMASTDPSPDATAAEKVDVPAPAADQAEAGTSQEAMESAPVSATPAEPAEKRVTVREPSQRPRFAPRRRRGWRGSGPRTRTEQRPESSRPGGPPPVQISDLLKEGQEIIVQIAKEPLGTKGARITSHIALPGRYLVYMPTITHIGVSRKISSEDERLRLRNIILENKGSLTGGFIVRTAGGGRSEEEFKADLRFLSTLWNGIKTKAEQTKAPALLHRDLDLVQRILRDTLSPDFKTVRVDNEVEYERCVEFVDRCQPSLVGHVKLYTKNTPLFEEFGIQAEIDKALKPKVWLKSGGYIVLNQTEALVAIDVNTGKFVGKTNRLEDTIVKTNIDAVNEIVRQIRLRDLGGILVIDFIDMDERRNRAKVVQALEEALRRDRAPTKVIAFNDFGLVAITRKRVKQSLERTLCQPCAYCSGSGWIKSLTSVCFEILGEVKKMAKELEGDTITLRVNPDVAHALKSRQGALLSEIETLTHKDVIIKSDPLVHQERFEIY